MSLDGRLTWNPLSATWLDSYSLAYTVASLLNQLFGKGKEPFWQQAYTNLVRWIIELYRVLPPQDGSDTPGWVTLRDVYHCAIDKELFAKKIEQAQTYAKALGGEWVTVPLTHFLDHNRELRAIGFTQHPADQERMRGPATPAVVEYLTDHKITHDRERFESAHATEIRLRVEAVHRWYVHDWNTLDNKIRSSIVEGVSVFLSMFDLPSIARVFCPPAPEARQRRRPADQEPTGAHGTDTTPLAAIALSGDLPPLDELIESGKVLALNMPAGTNSALARAIGVMLKNAWLQSLLRRPATMKREPGRYFRPAVFICDEYQAFASVGEDDPSGDEKAFALTRQCRVIPIVATAIHQLASLRARQLRGMANAPANAPHPDFLELERRGQRRHRLEAVRPGGQNQELVHHQRKREIERHQLHVRPGRRRTWERGREQEFSRAARGALSAARLRPAGQLSGDLSPLRRRPIAPAAPGVLEASLPPGGPPVLDRETDRAAMSSGDGLDLLKPFLPGLEAALEDPDVSEIMINGRATCGSKATAA